MRILHVISSGGMYGAEAVVLNLLRELRAGNDPHSDQHHGMLAVFDHPHNRHLELHEQALAEGIESHTLPCGGQIDRATVAALRTLANRTGVDVVHAHGYKADVYTFFASRGSRWPMLSTCHNWCDTDLFTRLYGALDRRVLRHAAAVVAVSAEVQRKLVQSAVPAGKVVVIGNGIRPDAFQATFSGRSATHVEDSVVGFAGRLSREKAPDLFVDAARAILAELPGTRFLIAGDGPERPALEAAIAAHGLADSITLLGRVDDMPAFYESLDLLLSTSRTEGMPIGLMEAMSSGLPVVATAVGDVPLLVEDGHTGALVPPGDLAALVRASLALLRDPERRFAYGQAGAQRIEAHFSAATMSRAYLALYHKVLSLHPEKHPDRADRR